MVGSGGVEVMVLDQINITLHQEIQEQLILVAVEVVEETTQGVVQAVQE
jgi:hypothetical protein